MLQKALCGVMSGQHFPHGWRPGLRGANVASVCPSCLWCQRLKSVDKLSQCPEIRRSSVFWESKLDCWCEQRSMSRVTTGQHPQSKINVTLRSVGCVHLHSCFPSALQQRSEMITDVCRQFNIFNSNFLFFFNVQVFFRGASVNAIRGFPMSSTMFLTYELSLRFFRGL